MSTDRRETPSSSLSAPPPEGESSGLWSLDEDLDARLDADDKGDGEKDPAEAEGCQSRGRNEGPVTLTVPSVLICPLRTWMLRTPDIRRRGQRLSR